MSLKHRPYIGRIWPHTWDNPRTGEQTPGLALGGAGGISAHLTKKEAYKLADDIVDAADKLPDPPQERQQTHCGQPPLYTSQTLTAADGTPEQPLPATPAD